MNTELRPCGEPEAFAKHSRAWPRAMMLAVRSYGVVALGFVWIAIQARMLTFMNPPFLALALLFMYALSVAVLAGVGLRQLRSGARRKAFLNLGLAALNGLLGVCAFYLINVESSKWL